MNRRSAISQLSLAATSLIVLPQWMISCGISNTDTHTTSFSASEQQTLAAIADTILPAANGIGALSVGVDKYLQKLFDECFEKKVQDNIRLQIAALERESKKNYQKAYAACSSSQRRSLLLTFDNPQNKEGKEFFDLVKTETIRGFNTSQKVMEEYLGYKVAPGHYYGCVNVKSS